MRGEPVAEDEGAEATGGEPVGHLAALEVTGQMNVGAAGKDDDGGAIFGALARPEDGERRDVVAGVALGLRRGSGPEADGLDAEKGIVGAGRGAVGRLRVSGGDGQRCRDEEGENCFMGASTWSARIIKPGVRV